MPAAMTATSTISAAKWTPRSIGSTSTAATSSCPTTPAGSPSSTPRTNSSGRKKTNSRATGGWSRADGTGIYHGHDKGGTEYDWDGNKVWHPKTPAVLSGGNLATGEGYLGWLEKRVRVATGAYLTSS